MSDKNLPASAPFFPLPNAVLFPKVLLPLRIFEDRYLAMIRDVLDSHGWLGIGLYRSGRELDESGHPDVYPVAGLGRVVDYQRAADGTYKVVVLGEQRMRVGDWRQVTPYPICELQDFPEREPSAPVQNDIRGRLRARIRQFVRKSIDSQVLLLLDQTIKECEDVGPLVDSIAYHFLRSPLQKQRLLETSDAERRETLLLEILEEERYGSEKAS